MPAEPRPRDNIFQVGAQTPLKPIYPRNPRPPRSGSSGKDGLVPVRQTSAQQTAVPMSQMSVPQMAVPTRQTSAQQMAVPIRQTTEQQTNDQLKQQQQLYENAKDTKALDTFDEDIESFFCNVADQDQADITSTSFKTVQQQSTKSSDKNGVQGLSFRRVVSLCPGKSKVLCCQFSSDGKLLATAGHDKKVTIWSTKTYTPTCTEAYHSHLITDVRFKPNSTVFGTSSFDATVQIWDADRPSHSLSKLIGHTGQVLSLDFHPRKSDLLCSCDRNDVIRLWNLPHQTCTRVFKGATRQVRFQPQVGNLLAAASGNGISLFDVETSNLQYYLEGHVKEVRALCWDTTGKYIASVSEDSARVWSVGLGGKCIHQLQSNGNKFESCTFHPGYAQLVITGSYQTIDLWNPTESNQTLTITAHTGLIAAMAESPEAELIASASHDNFVNIWK